MGKHDKKKSKSKADESVKIKGKKKGKGKAKVDPHLKHLDKIAEANRIANDKSLPKKERKVAREFLVSARQATEDREATKASTQAADPDAVDRADEAAVKAFNETHGKESGHYITSDAEKAASDERVKADAKPSVDDTDADRKARVKAKKAKREAEAENAVDETGHAVGIDEPVAQVAEQVETDKGREFAVGAPTEVPEEEEFDGLGRYKIYSPEKGRKVGYTRTTTYIDCLEDKTALTDWKMRMVLIGAGIDLKTFDANGDIEDSMVATARKAFELWNKGMAKLAKREAKGELDLGQFGLIEAELNKALKSAINPLAQSALDLGGANEKREKGTDLHALTERLDRGEFKLDLGKDDAAQMLIDTGQATHADIADLRAYHSKMRELGIEHFAIEQRIVVDELGVAGTLDRGSLYKFPGTTRRVRVVGDIKTGNVEWSAGKIGMQLDIYARGKTYDAAEPEARGDLKLSKTKALLIHLPAGKAECNVYEVDLDLANRGTKLAREVRDWRNAGKRVYNLKTPLLPEGGE